MIHAIRQDVVVLPGGRIEIASSELTPGVRAEVIVLAEEPTSPKTETALPRQRVRRRVFMKLPLQERRRILAEQADQMAEHYSQDTEVRDLGGGDFADC